MNKRALLFFSGIICIVVICFGVYLFTLHPAGAFVDTDFVTDKEILQLNYFIEENGYWMDSGTKNAASVPMRDVEMSISGNIDSGELVIRVVSDDGKVIVQEVLNASSSCDICRELGDLGYSFFLVTGVDKEYSFSGNIEVKVSYKALGYEKIRSYFGN